MALSDFQTFLEDLLLRYDPDLDITQGSNAYTKLIAPILGRIGPDPFDNDITTFITERVRQVYPDIAFTDADSFTDTTVDPMRTLIEPLVREIKLVKLRSDMRNAESLSDDEIDALAANFFETRQAGGFARGVVRLYFANPQGVSATQVNPASTRSGLRYYPTRAQALTADQMLLNREGAEYYFDVNYTAERRGDEYNVDPGAIVDVRGMPAVTRVKNLARFRDGVPREDSLEFLARVERNSGDKSMAVARGATASLSDAFPAARHVFVVGFGDEEMQRDVLTGGGLGRVPAPDSAGNFYGTGDVLDDGDGDLTTPALDFGDNGNLVVRIGSTGPAPEEWWVSIAFYADSTGLVLADVKLLEVFAPNVATVDYEIPLDVEFVTWALRRNVLSISDIPGGIALPSGPNGDIEVVPGKVHIGGKTDIYVAGATEPTTAQIQGLTDANPVTRGVNATTNGTDVVTLNDLPDVGIPIGVASLVLEEGDDAGSYRIVGRSGDDLTLATPMTASQTNLNWKIVDTIDVELTDPRDVKVDGDDLILAAGSGTVFTAGSVNFVDAGVLEGDILGLSGLAAGEYAITAVSATSLEVDPVMPRSLAAVAYSVFRRSEAVRAPIVRVTALDLLDSAGAPVGTKIPYANPVLVEARAFQNEGSGYVYEGEVFRGLILGPIDDVMGETWQWQTFNPARVWETLATGSITFGAVSDAAEMVTAINADPDLDAAGVKARLQSYNGNGFVGIISAVGVRSLGGTATGGWETGGNGMSNTMIRGLSASAMSRIRSGDLVEFTSIGVTLTTRVLVGYSQVFILGDGPVGPIGAQGAYDNVVLPPDTRATIRVGRPSLGSGRAYFLDPTSVDFHYATTRFKVEGLTQELMYRPDPENTRFLIPAPPTLEMPLDGELSDAGVLTDLSMNFLLRGVGVGDVLVVMYRPIEGDPSGLGAGTLTLSGTLLRLRLDGKPYVEISFPSDMTRQEAADYINEQMGVKVADLNGLNALRLRANVLLELDSSSSARTPLELNGSPTSTLHPDAGEYIIVSVSATELELFDLVLPDETTASTQYKIRRYTQRVSSTEMADNQDATGLYYADIEIISMSPGDQYNIETGAVMECTGHRADGYTLSVDNEVLSYSTGEKLFARISRSILLPGSADNPMDAVELSRQNVQVSYDRSGLVDEAQAYASSDLQRTTSGEILIRHLMPHYVSLSWVYASGALEPKMRQELTAWLDKVEPGGDELEAQDLAMVLRRNGAVSVYTPDPELPAGRQAPFFVVVYHDEARGVRARVVRDVTTTLRLQRFIADKITLRRVA